MVTSCPDLGMTVELLNYSKTVRGGLDSGFIGF